MIPTMVYGFGEWNGWKEKELKLKSRRDGLVNVPICVAAANPNVLHQLVLQTSKHSLRF